MNPMVRKKILFPRLNGSLSRGVELRVVVGGKIVDTPFIQTSMGSCPTHYRIAGSNIIDDTIAYRIKDSKYVDESINRIFQEVRGTYLQQRFKGIFFKPKIKVTRA